MLMFNAEWVLCCPPKERDLDETRAMDRFLAEVERRAFRIALVSVRDRDEALDIVQDAMIRLVRTYGARPSEEWRPLFFRILTTRTDTGYDPATKTRTKEVTVDRTPPPAE